MMKKIQSTQAPSSIIMVRPHHFAVNPATAADNAFQKEVDPNAALASSAHAEISRAAETLRSLGVKVHLFEDEGATTPDSVFPNNWFSTHADGQVALYPMMAPNRRLERRGDVIDMLKAHYQVSDVVDYSALENDGLFLEGTGSLVLDHGACVAYAVRSERTNPKVLDRFCTQFNFEPMLFDAVDANGKAIYHTNVLMCVATEFAMIGLGMIPDDTERKDVVQRLESAGKTIVDLTYEQIENFAGNAIELQAADKRILVLSKTAYDALDQSQKQAIEKSAALAPLDIPTIELSGGSIRCTIAGVHLTPRQ